MRVVLDTNIIVSAFLGGSLEPILIAFKQNKFTLLVSKAIADEYFNVLQRPKFTIEPDEFNDFASLIVTFAEFVEPTDIISIITSDPSDNKFLEAVIAGKADWLVSGDRHLLELASFRGINIITAEEFLQRLASEDHTW